MKTGLEPVSRLNQTKTMIRARDKKNSNCQKRNYQAEIPPHIEPILSCAEDSSYFEPLSSLSNEYLVHFTRLMEDYKAAEGGQDEQI